MLSKYLSVTKIGRPILILSSLIITVLNPFLGAIISGTLLVYLLLSYKLSRSAATLFSISAIICIALMLDIEDLSTLALEINTNYNDHLSAILVAAICISSITYFNSKLYKSMIILILLCFSALNILQTANYIKAENLNSENKISNKIETTLKKLNKSQLDQCITSQHVNGIPCFIFQKRYELITEDSNIQGIFSILKNRQVGIFSWSQMADARSPLLKNTAFTDTDHDVLMARIGVLNDENSIILLAAPIQNQKEIDSLKYITMFGLSLSLLIVWGAIILINEVEQSKILYLVAMATLMALGMHGVASLVSAVFVIMTIILVITYKKTAQE